MHSVWTESANMPKYEQLSHDIQTEVLVIGGGIAGILCAHFLTQAGIDCVLVEASSLCSGITKNTTAKITAQHGLIYNKLLQEFDEQTAKLYLDANLTALEEYRVICKNMDCDFERQDNFIYSINDKAALTAELAALQKIGYSAAGFVQPTLPFSTVGAVKFPNQVQFNPLKFLAHIAKDLKIYTHTPVQEIQKQTAYTPYGKITAKKIIIATHFPFINTHGFYFVKMYQQRSYVLALENADTMDGMYLDAAENGLSFRNYKNLLLIGGGGHRTGKPGGCWQELEQFAAKHYPQAAIKYRWATQDCMTLDGMPYVGLYSRNTPNLYVAAGFNKWGMTSAMAAAKLLCDLITEKPNPYTQIYRPDRSIWHKQLPINLMETTANLLTISKKRCPHLGCALKWNPQEHSWDCPCHGSRFTETGELIDNPAMKNLKK